MLMLFVSAAVSACASLADGSKPLPFELRQNAIVVPVMVSGQGPFRFLLDTGASRSLIRSRLAPRAGEGSRRQTLMLTPVGSSVRDSSDVVLQVGDREPVPVMATVASDEELERIVPGTDGILGQDVLSSLVLTIDYGAKLICWDVELPSTPASRIPLEIAGGNALVTLPHTHELSEPLRLIPDTGSDALVLFARKGRPLPAATPLDVGVLHTLTGLQLVRRVVVERLQLGDVTLRDQEAMVLSPRDAPFPAGDGLLPLHIFRSVTLNGPRAYMVVAR